MTPQLNTYIEDCIAQKDPLIKIMRLVCMQSVCNNGLKQKVLDFYKREILQVKVWVLMLQVSFKVASDMFRTGSVAHSYLQVDSQKNHTIFSLVC